MLSLQDICVKYSYKSVLKGVSLTFEEKTIYALLGENGAGKSTLAHVISGDLSPTSGRISLNNKPVTFNTPKDAIKNGIVCVHQRPLLAPSISILENLKLGISKEQERNPELLKQLLNTWLPEHKLHTPVKKLNTEECFYVALIGALLKNPATLILDEPPSLPKEKLQNLSESGITIIMITHNLNEAITKANQIILLQNGVVCKQSAAGEISEEEISKILYGISKEVEMPAIFKKQKIDENKLKHDFGKTGFIPSDKTFTASNPDLSILQLVTAFNPKGKQKELEKQTTDLLTRAEVNIKPYEKASCLSGGMLQRLILERELSLNPRKLILCNPTQGLDVEATEKLYSRLEALANSGTEIIFGEE